MNENRDILWGRFVLGLPELSKDKDRSRFMKLNTWLIQHVCSTADGISIEFEELL